ncbi:unnamed protein product [Phytophthora lilii]|uniref:Unnamed protein product n=1 Tax=Phytophthora lilii TaxID=2077276 RepID=A0A9W6U938_9STRA|nr:unnamed protein product [Phytophthora lilii]
MPGSETSPQIGDQGIDVLVADLFDVDKFLDDITTPVHSTATSPASNEVEKTTCRPSVIHCGQYLQSLLGDVEQADISTNPSRESGMWRHIALRNRAEREISEQENARLRQVVTTSTKQGRAMQRAFRRRPPENVSEMAAMPMMCYCIFEVLTTSVSAKVGLEFCNRILVDTLLVPPANNSAVFMTLKEGMDDAVESLRNTLFPSIRIHEIPCPGRRNDTARSMAPGQYVEVLDSYALPFDFQLVVRALWNLGSDGVEEANAAFSELEDPAAALALEQALAFADACDVGSDDDMNQQELDALLADVQSGGLFAPDALAPGEFTGLMLGADAPDADTSLESALAVLTTRCDASASDSSGDDAAAVAATPIATPSAAKRATKMKRARAPSPTRTAKDFAAANAAMAAANGTLTDVKKPTKKRIRRQREELLYLRVKVKEMESSLAQLKSREARSRLPSGGSTQLAVNGKPNSEGASLLASVWESLANRQYKDRERAEQENRKLKSTLEGQIKLAKCLEKILEDQPEDDTVVPAPPRPEQSKLLSLGVSSHQRAVHAQLLSELDAAFDEVDAVFDLKNFADTEKDKLDVRVSSSLDNGIALQFLGFKRVPFPQEIAARGMWRFTSCEATKRQAYFYEETSSPHIIARTFGHKIQSENGSLDYRSEGVIECRKRGDRVVILTRGLAKPIKFSAAPVNGIRFHENGWLVIEEASAKDGSGKGKWSTISSSMELTPIFDDDVLDQDFTVGALTDFVIDSFHRNMHLGEEVVAGIMMDEARKAATQPASCWP